MRKLFYRKALDLNGLKPVLKLEHLSVYYSVIDENLVVRSHLFKDSKGEAYATDLETILSFIIRTNFTPVSVNNYCRDLSRTKILKADLPLLLLHLASLEENESFGVLADSILKHYKDYTFKLSISLLSSNCMMYILSPICLGNPDFISFKVVQYKDKLYINYHANTFLATHKKIRKALEENTEITYQTTAINKCHVDYMNYVVKNSKLLRSHI
jgi:hypothetical protein